MRTAMYDIVVIGNPLYNSVSTPEFTAKERILSGPAINISRTVAELGIGEMVVIGALSHEFQSRFTEDLNSIGIPEHYALESPTTGGFHINCDEDGAPTVQLLDSARSLKIRDIPDEFLRSRAIIVAPSYREIDSELVGWISDSSDALIVLDTQGMGIRADEHGLVGVRPNGNDIQDSLEHVQVAKLERPVWRQVTGESDPLLAAENIVERGVEIAIIMLSSMGAVVYDGSEFLITPFEKAARRNVLAFSDAFLASYAVGLVQRTAKLERAALASSAASIIMEGSCTEFSIAADELHRRKTTLLERIVIR
jgi:sugar/nucleoside kinase (ribokinase family)